MGKAKHKAIKEAIEGKIKRIYLRTWGGEGLFKKKAKAQTLGHNTDGLSYKNINVLCSTEDT